MHDPSTLSLDKAEVSLFQTLDGVGKPCLIRYSGGDAGRRLDLDNGTLVLGRGEDAELVIDGRGISRRHACMTVSNEGVQLRDLGSANGTFVNDVKLQDEVALNDGDLVRVANVVFRFHDRRSLDALLHDRLYRLATVDPGTGVFNRRYLQEALKLEVARARRANAPLTLISCDLDHFKAVNDTFGHAAGDTVLKESARVLRAGLRGGDMIGRWGGEEFVVVARDTGLPQAQVLAERLRTLVAEHRFELLTAEHGALKPAQHRQTLSLGVAMLLPEMQDEHDLLAVADRCMYAAKRNGRNRVVVDDVPGS